MPWKLFVNKQWQSTLGRAEPKGFSVSDGHGQRTVVIGYLLSNRPWNKKSKMRFKGARSSYLRFLGFTWGFGRVLNKKGLKRQNLGFRVMRNLHKLFGDIFEVLGVNFSLHEKEGWKALKNPCVARVFSYLDTYRNNVIFYFRGLSMPKTLI